MDRVMLNKQMQKEFNEHKNYDTLERYVMSELLSPIEDYLNAIDLIRKHSNLVKGLNLYYIAAYLSAEWRLESNEYSKCSNFVNNRYDLACISKAKEAQFYLEEAIANVQEVATEESLIDETIDFWLSSQRFIDEFILGTDISYAVYMHKFGETKLI